MKLEIDEIALIINLLKQAPIVGVENQRRAVQLHDKLAAELQAEESSQPAEEPPAE